MSFHKSCIDKVIPYTAAFTNLQFYQFKTNKCSLLYLPKFFQNPSNIPLFSGILYSKYFNFCRHFFELFDSFCCRVNVNVTIIYFSFHCFCWGTNIYKHVSTQYYVCTENLYLVSYRAQNLLILSIDDTSKPLVTSYQVLVLALTSSRCVKNISFCSTIIMFCITIKTCIYFFHAWVASIEMFIYMPC